MAQVLDAREHLQGLGAHPAGVQGDDQLAGLGRGDPRLVAHAADAQAGDHERVPGRSQPAGRVRAAERAAEDRVVPVHGEPALVRERLRVAGHQVPELVRRELPVRPRVVGQLGQRDRAAQALVDARAPGKQRVAPGGARRVALPADLTARRAQRERPLHRAADRRPHDQAVPLVAGHQVLVPGADRDVRRVVALRRRVRHPAGLNGPGPGPVGALGVAQPPVGAPGRLAQPAGAQGHRALDVIPGVDVPVWPRDRPRPFLHPGDGLARREHLGPAQWFPGKLLPVSHPPAPA